MRSFFRRGFILIMILMLILPAFALSEELNLLGEADVNSSQEESGETISLEDKVDGAAAGGETSEFSLADLVPGASETAASDIPAASGSVRGVIEYTYEPEDISSNDTALTDLTIEYIGEPAEKVYDFTRNVTKTVDDKTEWLFTNSPMQKSNFKISGKLEDHPNVELKAVNKLVQTFTDWEVGEYELIFGFSLQGADAEYYNPLPVTIPARITPRPVTIIPYADQSKVYGQSDPSWLKWKAKNVIAKDNKPIERDGKKSYELSGKMTREAGEDVGSYKILLGTLSFGPNYEVTTVEEETFAIERKDISDDDVVANDIEDRTYKGKAIKPVVTLRYGSYKLKNNTDYAVTYKNSKDVGTAKVVITGKGNFDGKRTETFDILPKGTGIKSLTGQKSAFTVTWNKQTAQVTGYQIEYATDSDFTNAKQVSVKSAKTTKKKISGLSAWTKYYVRVRTYRKKGGKLYRSAWSKVKGVTTK